MKETYLLEFHIGIPETKKICDSAYGGIQAEACEVLKGKMKAMGAGNISADELVADKNKLFAILEPAQGNSLKIVKGKESDRIKNFIGELDRLQQKYGEFKIFNELRADMSNALQQAKKKEGAQEAKVAAQKQKALEDKRIAAANEKKRLAALEKQRAASRKEREAIKAKNQSPECQAAREKLNYCQQVARVVSAQMSIDFEKKVGAESGYVNKAKLRNTGAAKIKFQQFADQSLEKYHSLTGQTISAASCQLQENKVRNMASVSENRYKEIEKEILAKCGSRLEP